MWSKLEVKGARLENVLRVDKYSSDLSISTISKISKIIEKK